MANTQLTRADCYTLDAKGEEKLIWFPLAFADKNLAKAHDEMKAANEAAKRKREAFETAARKRLANIAPEGHGVVFSYRFGNDTVSYPAPDDPKYGKSASKASDKPKTPTITL